MSRRLERIGAWAARELDRFAPADSLREVVAVWAEATGPAVAANAWPSRLGRDGTLHVAASSSAWAFELTQLEATIRARLRERLGEKAPPRLRFAVGHLPERGAGDVPIAAPSVPRVTPASAREGERLASGIADPELRALVARAAAASLAGRERKS